MKQLKHLITLQGCGFILSMLIGVAHANLAPKTMVSINFDDGYKSAYDSLPLFEEAGIKVTLCVITGRIGRPGYVTIEEVLDEERRGHELCAHTRTHPDLSLLSPVMQSNEILGSKQDLETLLGHTVKSFAYPFGKYTNSTVGYTMISGFSSARTTRTGGVTDQSNPFVLRAYPLQSKTSIEDVHKIIDYAVKNKIWVIILLHRVDETGKVISVSHELIKDMIEYIQLKNIPIVTNSEGIKILGIEEL